MRRHSGKCCDSKSTRSSWLLRSSFRLRTHRTHSLAATCIHEHNSLPLILLFPNVAHLSLVTLLSSIFCLARCYAGGRAANAIIKQISKERVRNCMMQTFFVTPRTAIRIGALTRTWHSFHPKHQRIDWRPWSKVRKRRASQGRPASQSAARATLDRLGK